MKVLKMVLKLVLKLVAVVLPVLIIVKALWLITGVTWNRVRCMTKSDSYLELYHNDSKEWYIECQKATEVMKARAKAGWKWFLKHE